MDKNDNGQRFAVGDKVSWTSSNTLKEGTVTAVLPPGVQPDHGLVDVSGQPRPHETYIIRGGVPHRRPKHYWPMVSLLKKADGLTDAEIAWCHMNAARVRELMQQASAAQ